MSKIVFVHMINKIFPVIGPLLENPAPLSQGDRTAPDKQ